MSIRVGPTQRTVKSIFKVKNTEFYCILIFEFPLSTTGLNLVLKYCLMVFLLHSDIY